MMLNQNSGKFSTARGTMFDGSVTHLKEEVFIDEPSRFSLQEQLRKEPDITTGKAIPHFELSTNVETKQNITKTTFFNKTSESLFNSYLPTVGLTSR